MRKRNPKRGFRPKGLMFIHQILDRANINNVRPTYSAAHYRRKFGLKKIAAAVRKATMPKNR